MRHLNVKLAVVFCVALGAGNARAQNDWTQWRGANRDGVARNFDAPKVWPEKLARKWKVAAGGGYSSPVVAGSRVTVAQPHP